MECAHTPKSLAKLWSVTPETVVRLIKDGRLRGFRIGAQYRVRPEDAEAYQSSQTTGPTAAIGEITTPQDATARQAEPRRSSPWFAPPSRPR